jgi:SAM-dependent methyltransferase
VKIDYEAHYDDAYFTGQKTYKAADGSTQLYHGPSLTWDGFEAVAEALRLVLGGRTLLDIGCSAGDLARRLQKRGFDAYGCDISNYAVAHAVPEMKGKLAVADITQRPEHLDAFHGGSHLPDQYDVVIATDLLEHIYEEDLDPTLTWMIERSKRWLFFLVATAAFDKDAFVARKGMPIPPEFEATAVSGHVNVRSWKYWVKKFREQGAEIRYDLMYIFQMQREMNPAWRDTMGWNMHTTFILETLAGSVVGVNR